VIGTCNSYLNRIEKRGLFARIVWTKLRCIFFGTFRVVLHIKYSQQSMIFQYHNFLKICYNCKKGVLCEEPYEKHVRKWTYVWSFYL